MEYLIADLAVTSAVRLPLISLMGAAGLFLFFTWQAMALLLAARRTHQCFERVCPALELLQGRIDRLRHDAVRAQAAQHSARRGSPMHPSGLDEEGLATLAAVLQSEERFRRPWQMYLKTLVIEQVPWFRDARIYSTRDAEDYFPYESVAGTDRGLRDQVPGLLTSLGLLLTFVALCIGLTSLHVEGTQLSGLQGLINGLAAKFVTSIVGLASASLFVLLDKPVVRRLRTAHQAFVARLDELFPRKTLEQALEELKTQHQDHLKGGPVLASDEDRPEQQPTTAPLATQMAALTIAIEAMSAAGAAAGQRGLVQTMVELTAAVQSLSRAQQPLLEGIHELTRERRHRGDALVSSRLGEPATGNLVHDLLARRGAPRTVRSSRPS